MKDRLLSLGAMARRLGVTTKWLREQAEQGKLPHLKADDRYLFEPDTVCSLLIEQAKINGLENPDIKDLLRTKHSEHRPIVA